MELAPLRTDDYSSLFLVLTLFLTPHGEITNMNEQSVLNVKPPLVSSIHGALTSLTWD